MDKLADLFFQADEMLSRNEAHSLDLLRRRYRLWRHKQPNAQHRQAQADGTQPIAHLETARPYDELRELKMLADADRQRLAKMKRVQTEPDGVDTLARRHLQSAAAAAAIADRVVAAGSTPTSPLLAPALLVDAWPQGVRRRPLRSDADAAARAEPVGEAPAAAPVLRAGGCPFPQGKASDLPPAGIVDSDGLTGLVVVPSQPAGAASSQAVDAPAPAAAQLTPQQLAAFQVAYIKALDEERERHSRLLALCAPPPVAAAAASSSASVQLAGPVGQEQPHASTGADDSLPDAKPIATSCAHGPLVTHPRHSGAGESSSAMLASVFPSLQERWLYVILASEFGVPFAMGLTEAGCAYGRLEFDVTMQQWALKHTDPQVWASINLDKLLPALYFRWRGTAAPPLSDSRWVCFPYLGSPPESTLDLQAAIDSSARPLTSVGSDHILAQPLDASIVMPAAVEQRDITTIGARPTPTQASTTYKRGRPTQTAEVGNFIINGYPSGLYYDADPLQKPALSEALGKAKRQRVGGAARGSGSKAANGSQSGKKAKVKPANVPHPLAPPPLHSQHSAESVRQLLQRLHNQAVSRGGGATITSEYRLL